MKISIAHPYDVAFSKNEWHAVSGEGKIYNNASANALMRGIFMLVRGECNRYRLQFKSKKTWVRIVVYRPDMRVDPINFLGMICDGVKRGLGIDDNLFAGSVDWKLLPESPEIIIEIEQEDE